MEYQSSQRFMANEGIEAEAPDSIKGGYKRVADLSVVKA